MRRKEYFKAFSSQLSAVRNRLSAVSSQQSALPHLERPVPRSMRFQPQYLFAQTRSRRFAIGLCLNMGVVCNEAS